MAVIPSIPADDRASSIVVGVDGSATSLSAVDLAVELSERRNAPLDVVHAWEVPRSWSPLVGEYPLDVSTFAEMHQGVLDDALDYARRQSSHPHGHLEMGPAAVVLARIGRGAALIVVASHNSSAVTRLSITRCAWAATSPGAMTSPASSSGQAPAVKTRLPGPTTPA